MSPLSQPNPCLYLSMKGNLAICEIYEQRPSECRNHEFSFAKFCPIGMDILKLDREGAVARIQSIQEIRNVNLQVYQGHPSDNEGDEIQVKRYCR